MLTAQRPPTPPEGTPELLHDLHYKNGGAAYQYESEASPYPDSVLHSAYGSPVMQDPYMEDGYSYGQYPELHDPNQVGLGIQYVSISLASYLHGLTPL